MKSNSFRLYCVLLLIAPPATIIAKISRCRAATLAWNANAEKDLAGYKAHYGTSSRGYPSVVTLGKVTSLDLQDLRLYESNTYYIALTAYDYSYNESAFSSELTFFADDEIPPDEDNCRDIYNPDQEDTMPPEGNGIGDACECHADTNCDGKVDLSDLSIVKQEFGSTDCDIISCDGDLNYDGKVDLADMTIIKIEFLRTNCPACP